MLESITWLLIIEFIGLLALPASFAFFKFLPDRGYSLSKVFALLVGGFAVWFIGMVGLPFTALTSWLIIAGLFVGLAVWLMSRNQGELRVELDEFLRERRGLLILIEIIFILAYFYLVNMRSYMPEIRDQEKFGDFAFFNSMVLHSKLPPADPWMSGYTINYYYFSHFLMAMLTKMSGIAPAIAFNLTIPLIFGLTATAAFGLVYNLVVIAKSSFEQSNKYQVSSIKGDKSEAGSIKSESFPDNRQPTTDNRSSSNLAAIFAGIFALAGICLLGNLDSARQVLFPASSGSVGGFLYNWWSPSRVVYDFMPQPIGDGNFRFSLTENITEFPMFSFLLADTHPHVMTLPFVLLVISAALNVLRAPAGAALLNLRTGEGRYFFVVLALAVGSLYFLNTWDYPTYLLLIILVAAVRELRLGKQEQIESTNEKPSGWLDTALLGGPILHKSEISNKYQVSSNKEDKSEAGSITSELRDNSEVRSRKSETNPQLATRNSQLFPDHRQPSTDNPSSNSRLRFARWLGFSLRLAIASLALYLPFHLTFTSLIGDSFVPEAVNLPILGSLAKTFLVVVWDRTPLISQDIILENGETATRWGYLMVYGLFLFPIISLLVLKLWPYFKKPYAYLDENEEAREQAETYQSGEAALYGRYLAIGGVLALIISMGLMLARLNPVIVLLLGLFSAPLTAAGVGLIAYDYLGRVRVKRPEQNLLIVTGFAALLMIGLGWYLRFQLYGPLLILFSLSVLLVLFENRQRDETEKNFSLSQADQFVLLLVALPALITFTIEIVFLRDVFNARLNTIFKFYYQAWVMYALAAAYAAWRVAAWGWQLAPFNQPESELEPELTSSRKTGVSAPTFRPRPQASLSLGLAGANGGNVAYRVYSGAPTIEPETLPDELDEEARDAEKYVQNGPRRPIWRWVWGLGLGLLILSGLIYPLFAPYEKTGHYRERQGLNGEQWLTQWYPEDYAAIKWMRAQSAKDPSFEGPVLETAGPDWFDYNRVGVFSGFPVLMGWPGHELQWRGGKANTREEVNRRVQDIDIIYSTNNVEQAKALLQKYGLKYVFVGTLETGARDGRWYDGNGQPIKKNYPPEALAKFSLFMKPIYQQDGVTIYSF